MDDLEQAVWGDDSPISARHTIATHIFRLRRLGLAINTRDDLYILETPTDALEVERLAAEGGAALDALDRAAAKRALSQAVSLWRGRPLIDLDDLPEAEIAAARLQELVDRLREDLLGLELDEGKAAELVGVARQLVDEQPYRERRWELLMLALYRAGRQADALDAYAECRRRLIDDLGLDPGTSLRRMQQAVLAQDPALEAPSRATSQPATTSGSADNATSDGAPIRRRVPGTSTRLIGRAAELADLAEVWERARLVTLQGPPGAGKTRLALELARDASVPVWFVGLEELSESRSVGAAILDVVAPSSRAADASEGVVTALGERQGLIVLDGCEERQADVAVEIARILESCPQMRIVATSRERLGLLDEAVIPIGPLATNDAIDLLVDRARLLNPRFRLSANDAATADRLCALVDRLPLGLELVARHLQLLRLDEVVDRVQSDLGRWAGGPVGGRAGLWAALDSSLERLGPQERQTLVALAVVTSEADLDLISAVAGLDGGIDCFEIVARLVDASLVQVRSGAGPTRYELLRTLAGRTLETAAQDNVASARARYADTVLARAADLATRLSGADRSDTLRLLDGEIAHVRAILDRLIGPPVDEVRIRHGLEVAVGLTDYWLGRHPGEGLDWLVRLVQAADPSPALRAEAYLAAGHLAYWVTDFERGDRLVAEAQALFESLGDSLGEGRALRRRGAIAAATDDLSGARALLEASLERLDEAGVEREIGTTLLHLGSLLADEGIAGDAKVALERSLAIAARTGDPLANGLVLAALNLAYWKGGDLETAMQTGNEALLIFRELGHSPTEGAVAYRLAAIARGLDRPRAARRYAQLAIDAGERSSTRTTIAQGHINLARLDLDIGDSAAAAGHLVTLFDLIDPESDRWVLAEALEAAARLLVAVDRPGAMSLLDSASAIREAIQQPVAPTEAVDLQTTLLRAETVDGRAFASHSPLDPAAALALAVTYVREIPRPAPTRVGRQKA